MNDPFEKPVKNILANLQRARTVMVKRMGALALYFIEENFEKQGFQGETFEPWAKRLDPKDQTRPILTGKGSGLLKRSPHISYSDAQKAIITSSLPYSRIHNEGGDINHPSRDVILNFDQTPANARWRLGKVRTINQQRQIKTIRRATIGAHTTHMPPRQYMGSSPVLTQRIREMILKEGAAAFKIIN
jgi:phage gpG-like protein